MQVVDRLIQIRDLVNHLGVVRHDGVEFLEGLLGLLEGAHFQVDHAQVVDGLDAVGLHADGLEVKLLGHVQLPLDHEAVPLVHKSLGVVPVVGVRHVRVNLGLDVVLLQKVDEAEVGGGHALVVLVLFFEELEPLDSLGEVPPPQVHQGQVDLKLRCHALVVRLEDVYGPLVAGGPVALVELRRHEPGRRQDVPVGLLLPLLELLPQGVAPGAHGLLVVHGLGLVAILPLLLGHALHRDAQQLCEPALHLLRVPQCQVAQDQVEARVEVRAAAHDRLVRSHGVGELSKTDEGVPDVSEDLESDLLAGLGYLVEGHSVHLDRLRPLLLLVVDVSHVHAQPP
mmetsp:Transcript_38063/g.85033  ORF Transcript_38063/g.85033 Transcript_38063/m.85033 type:complete len:340 (+) Transcript_38063:566-1585(+)